MLGQVTIETKLYREMSCKMERKDSAYTPVINGNPSHFIPRHAVFQFAKIQI